MKFPRKEPYTLGETPRLLGREKLISQKEGTPKIVPILVLGERDVKAKVR
jgi:hypothetical protein